MDEKQVNKDEELLKDEIVSEEHKEVQETEEFVTDVVIDDSNADLEKKEAETEPGRSEQFGTETEVTEKATETDEANSENKTDAIESEKSSKIGKKPKIDKKTLKRIAAILVAVIVVIGVSNALIKQSHRNLISKTFEGECKEVQVSNLKINIPKTNIQDLTKESDRYTCKFTNKDQTLAVIEINYNEDANGSSVDNFLSSISRLPAYNANGTEIKGNGFAGRRLTESLDPNKAKEYGLSDADSFTKDTEVLKVNNSIIDVSVCANDEYYNSEIINTINNHIDFASFKTPLIVSIELSYDGDTAAGVELNKDNSGIKVTAVYDNGKKSDVTGIAEISGSKKFKPDSTAELNAEIKDWRGEEYKNSVAIECSTKVKSLKATYSGKRYAGKEIKKTNKNLVVEATLEDGTKEVVTDYTLKGPKKLKAGETSKFTVKYGKAETTFSVECNSITEEQYKNKCKSYSYSELLRNYRDHIDEDVVVSGKVIQVIGSAYLVSSGGDIMYIHDVRYESGRVLDPDKDLYSDDDEDEEEDGEDSGGSGISGRVYLPISKDRKSVIEDDYITVYGRSGYTKNYTTVLGAKKTVPQIDAYFISF